MNDPFKINYDIKTKQVTNMSFQQGNKNVSAIEFTVFENGVATDITGETIEFRFHKPDGTKVYQDISTGVIIADGTSGVVNCVLTNDVLAIPGLIKCQIYRKLDTKELFSPTFNFIVKGSLGGDGLLSVNYISQIESKILEWQGIADSLTNGVDGIDGIDGADGITPIKNVDYFDGINGIDGATYDDTVIKADVVNIAADLTNITTQPNGDMRVILVSDTHLYSESQTNFTSDQRMQLMVDSLNTEHNKKPIDFVLLVGDISHNNISMPTKDGVADLKNNYLSQLNMPYYCLHGNHDQYTNAEWKALFGYEKNYTISFGKYAFICLDHWNDSVNVISSGWGASVTDTVWLNEQLTKFKDKHIFICDHYFDNIIDTVAFNIIQNTPNVVALFMGHVHDDIATGSIKKTYRTGNFSYPPNYDWTKGNDWGFRNLEIRDNVMQTEMIYIPHVYDTHTREYEVTKMVEIQSSLPTVLGDIDINAKSKSKHNSDFFNRKIAELNAVLINVNLALLSIPFLANYLNVVTNGNFVNVTGWTANYATLSATNNVLSVVGTGGNFSADAIRITSTPTLNKVIYMCAKVRTRNALCLNLSLRVQGSSGGGSVVAQDKASLIQDEWYTLSGIVTLDSTQLGNIKAFTRSQYSNATNATGQTTETKEFMVVDVTSLSVNKQTKEWCDLYIPFKV